jgi:methionyl aminopeptidase
MTAKKDAQAIASTRTAGQVVGAILYELRAMSKPGITPRALDQRAREILQEHKAEPAFLDYHGYPATICVSVNDVVVHGIPSDQPFRPGDLVSIDAGAIVDGYYADAAISVVLEPALQEDQELIRITQAALEAGIERVRAGRRLGDVQAAIQRIIDEAGYGIVYELTGHGIGRALHEDPSIPNFGEEGTGPTLQAGMTICLEPMVTLGSPDVYTAKDGWTIRTQDGSRAAHFEHTVLVTETGGEILTEARPWPQ